MMNWLDQRIQFRRLSGKYFKERPLLVVEDYDDPVVALEGGHPFVEWGFLFLMRDLLQIACPPDSADEAAERLLVPPSVAELEAAVAPYRHAFVLDHPDQPFLQVRPIALPPGMPDAAGGRQSGKEDAASGQDDEESPEAPGTALEILSLLPDQPTQNVLGKGDDFFAHGQWSGSIALGLVPPLLHAHMSLFPSTGGGLFGVPHGADSVKFALRGRTLWQTIWSNVLERTQERLAQGPWPAPCDASVFPWLDPSLRHMSLKRGAREARRMVGQRERHPCAIPMPRRYLLDPPLHGRCALSGIEGPAVRRFRRWPNGLQYAPEGWWHPGCAEEVACQRRGDRWRPRAARDGQSAGPRFLKTRRPLRFDDILPATLADAPSGPPADVVGDSWTRHAPPPVLQALAARRGALSARLRDRAASETGRGRPAGHCPLSVRALAQIFDGKVAVATSERELPLHLLDGPSAELLAQVVAGTVDTLRAMARLLRHAATAAAGLDHHQGSLRLAADLEDGLLRALDVEAIALPARLLALWREPDGADDRTDAVPAPQQELLRRGRTEALGLFDQAFPLLKVDAAAIRIAHARRRLALGLNGLAGSCEAGSR